MKRTLKYALSAVLGAALAMPALAQDQFPDVPANHWAYKDLLEMKQNGLLVGYPDGLFRGGRPASRYELAVACHAVWANLKAQQDALKSQMDDLARRMDNVATKADLDALRSQLDALSAEVNRIKSEDIARLNRLIDEFRGELTRMGADVNQMKSDIKAIGDRLTKVEGRLPNFDVRGSLDMVALNGYSRSDRFGITVDGRPTGFGRGSYFGDTVGVTRDFTTLEEAAFTITSHNDDPKAVKFHVTGVAGNMLGFGGNLASKAPVSLAGIPFGSQSWVYAGTPFNEGDTSFYFQDFYLKWDTSIAGLKFNAQVGRVDYKVSPYIFQRPDTTPYFKNDRWDNHRWTFDGGILGFDFGKAKLDVFGGRTTSVEDSQGNLLQPMFTGRSRNYFALGDSDRPRGFGESDLMVDQFLGANLGLPLGDKGKLSFSYIRLDSNDVVATGTSIAPKLVNGTAVMGADLHYNFSNFHVMANYAKSDEVYNAKSINKDDNTEWSVGFRYMPGGMMEHDKDHKESEPKWSLGATYRDIQPNFSAPGDWGRIGIWWNPTGIRGFMANAMYRFSDRFWLGANGGWYTGTDTTDRFGFTGLSNDDKLSHYNITAGFKLCDKANLKLGYEAVNWDIKDRGNFIGGKPREGWFNAGIDWDLGNRARMSFLWQMSDYDGKGVGGFNPFGNSRDPKATGGIFATQVSIKF